MSSILFACIGLVMFASSPGVSNDSLQTIAFPNPGLQILGVPVKLVATSTSGLPVTFTSRSTSVCTVTSDGSLQLVAVGECSVDADQGGDAYHEAAPTVNAVFHVESVDLLQPDPDPDPIDTLGTGPTTIQAPPGMPRMGTAVTKGVKYYRELVGSWRCINPVDDPGWCARQPPYSPKVHVGADSVVVSFEAPSEGANSILDYVIVATGSNGHSTTVVGKASPIVLRTANVGNNSLESGSLYFNQTYTFQVYARNGVGDGPASAPSNPVSLPMVVGTERNPPTLDFPVVSSLEPDLGATRGLSDVILKGSFLAGATAVYIGGKPVGLFKVKDANTIELVTAAGTEGLKDVSVSTSQGVGMAKAAYKYLKISQDFSVDPLPATVRLDSTLTVTGAALNPLTFDSYTPRVCTVSTAGVVQFRDSGSCRIMVSAKADSMRFAGETKIVKTKVLPLDLTQEIVVPDPGVQSFGTNPTLAGSSSSGLPLAWTTLSAGVCTVASGGRLSFSDSGTCIVRASQGGNARYKEATPVERRFPVVFRLPPAPLIGVATARDGRAQVTFSDPPGNGGSPIRGYKVVASPGGIIAEGASSPITVTGLTNGTAYSFKVVAINRGGEGAASAASNLVVPRSRQNIEFPDPGAAVYGEVWKLAATSGCGLPVQYRSTKPSALRISNDTAFLVDVDTATIVASQPGDAGCVAAPEVGRKVSISRRVLAIVDAKALDKVYDGTTAATLDGARLRGVVGTDEVVLSVGKGEFLDPAAGGNKPVKLSGSILSGKDASRYLLPSARSVPGGAAYETEAEMSATILRREVVVEAKDARKEVGGEDPILSWAARGLLSGDTLDGHLERAPGEASGTYPIVQGTLSAGSNYRMVFKGADFVISGGTSGLVKRPSGAIPSAKVSPSIRPDRPFSTVARNRSRAILGTSESACADGKCLSVELALSSPARVRVAIYDNLGTRVLAWADRLDAWQLGSRIRDAQGRIPVRLGWNLRDGNGVPVPAGVYLWKIEVVGDDGRKLETVERLGVQESFR